MDGGRDESEFSGLAIQMKTHTKILIGIVAFVGFAWLCWEAVRIRIETRDYTRLSDVPGFRDCPRVDDVGPVRTIRYRHPHDNHETGATWITGEWPGNGFRDFATESRLKFDVIDGESMNQESEFLPSEFKRGIHFGAEDFTAYGRICGGRHSLLGAHSAERDAFSFGSAGNRFGGSWRNPTLSLFVLPPPTTRRAT